ncbi:conjugal transfer protein TraC [Desulforhopalus sp. IMCC35007]|uniref:conjugal transfer protein TraC n=1 Tax=Desulforhopalus sp. IMCC35007 TaxID=2569543 RepID=UPI0010ADED60|nr:conjugal transfer protein TraC [Desulforhopalus sp. IMCC35007]TKB08866.1 conjugal transfer protein TraC [Desulforhopalus sp. IMCC35007]
MSKRFCPSTGIPSHCNSPTSAGHPHRKKIIDSKQSPFSSYLNYLAYDPELELYLNQDGSLGLLWECSPVIYAGPKTITALEGLFRAGLPKDSVIQLLFHADSHIEPILDRYQNCRSRTETIVSSNTDAVVSFLVEGKKGLQACPNIPVRNFRLFVAVKIPGDTQELKVSKDFARKERTAPLLDIKRQIHETLKAALLSPCHMHPGSLLEWRRRLLNSYPENYPEQNFHTYNPTIPLRKQIINSDTVVREESDHMRILTEIFFG